MTNSKIKTRTYGELLEVLNGLTSEQLEQDITFKDKDEEYYGMEVIVSEESEDDVLDKGHAFLEINAKIYPENL